MHPPVQHQPVKKNYLETSLELGVVDYKNAIVCPMGTLPVKLGSVVL